MKKKKQSVCLRRMWIQTRKTLAVIGSEINHRLSVNMKKYRRLNQDMPVFSRSFKAN